MSSFAVLVIACGQPIPSNSPSLVAIGSAFPTGLRPPTQDQIAEAIRFRLRFGLRADEEWVRAVAVDEVAQTGVAEFGFPLTPTELADMLGREFDLDAFETVRGYGNLFPDDFAGASLDQASSGIVVWFKARADQHQVALRNLLPPSTKLVVKQVRWSLKDLDGFVRTVAAERPWFETIGVVYLTADRRSGENFIYVRYQGPEEAAALILAHFGLPPWLHVERDGPLPWTGPRGDLAITVIDEEGRPIPQLWCEAISLDPMAPGTDETIFGTDQNGRCILNNLPAVEYEIRLHRWVDDDHYGESIKVVRASVESEGTTLRVVVPVQ